MSKKQVLLLSPVIDKYPGVQKYQTFKLNIND